MAGFFSRLKGKDGPAKISKSKKGAPQAVNDIPQKPRWEDAWTRKSVDPEEVQELLRGCTLELKSRGMFSLIFPLISRMADIGKVSIMHDSFIWLLGGVTQANWIDENCSAGYAIPAFAF